MCRGRRWFAYVRWITVSKCALLVNCSLEAIKIQLVDAWRLRSFLGATCWKNCVSSNFCSKNRDISGSLKYLKIINKIILIRKFYFKIGKNFNKDRTLSLLIFLSSRSKKHIISGLRTKTKTASIAESWGNPRYTTLCPGSQCVHRCVYNRV